LGVDERTSGGVNEQCFRTHLTKTACIEQVMGGGQERYMQCHCVCLFQQLIEAHKRCAVACRGTGLGGDVMGYRLIAHCAGFPRDGLADGTETDNP
jgi:cyanophycinase-like exopeptidase